MNASAYSSLDYVCQLHALFTPVYLIPEDVLSGNSKAIWFFNPFLLISGDKWVWEREHESNYTCNSNKNMKMTASAFWFDNN